MPNKLYLECYSGISGDMTVAALLDLGADQQVLLEGLESLNLSGYQLKIGRVKKNGIDACDFDVILDEPEHHPSPAKYYENMKTIIDKLLALYPECKIVLHRPVWYSPNTYNGAKYLEEGLNRLQSYYPELQALVLDYSKHFPGQVFMGDTDGFDYFKTHYKNELFPEKGNAGTFYLHPNRKGASALGELWGKAILGAIDN